VRAIMIASAAIPGAFPPVFIDVEVDGKRYEEMHVDGGAMTQVFAYPSAVRLDRSEVDRERHLYVIRNARLDPDWAQTERKTMNIGGALGLGASTTIFLGMVEAPLVIKPYLKNMTRSELFSLMTVGLACIAGTVMILYATILNGVIPDPLGHILVASFIHVAAAITIARIMVPETGEETAGSLIPPRAASSSMDAIVKGTTDGLYLLLNIVAMLLVMVALVQLVNLLVGLLPNVGGQPLTLQRILGFVMAPVVWLFGIPWAQAQTAGSLMGTKTILNELLAFLDLAKLPSEALDARSRLIMTYALTSFANFGSLGILIGGLGSLAPERRDEVVGLGMYAILAGTLATCMTGAVVGILT